MPREKADDSDEDWDYSDLEYDSDMPDVVSSDSDEEFQEDFMHRAILGRPRSKIYDSKDYISEATGRAERSGLDAGRLEGTNHNWKAAEGSKRQRRSPAAFEAGAASCFKRGKPSATAAVAGPVSSPAPPVDPPRRGRSQVRKTARQQRKDRYGKRAEARLEAQRQVAALEHDMSNELFLEFSWRQRRAIAVSTYSQARAASLSKTDALKTAALASRASWQSVHGWVSEWRKGDGVLAGGNWGKNCKIPHYFQDAEVKLKAAKWWRSHQPKQGKFFSLFTVVTACFTGDKNPRLADFVAFLVGTERNGWVGILTSLLPDAKNTVSVESGRRFTISLGFEYQELRKGSFNHKHEDPSNQQDRVHRFLPEYDAIWKAGPSQVLVDGQLVDGDIVADVAHRVCRYQVTGGDGKTRIVDFGGVVPETGTAKLSASHDECCFKAGEVEKAGWKEKGKQSCVDKTDGPSLHVAGFSCEFGNGCICTCPDLPAPYPISIFKLREWDEAFTVWKNDPTCEKPELPITADVWMYPGKSPTVAWYLLLCLVAGSGKGKHGWWKAEDVWAQARLACEIFQAVFGNAKTSRFKFCPTYDWSQNHAAKAPDAHDAEAMNVSSGGQQPHQRHTFIPEIFYPDGRPVARKIMCTPACHICKAAYDKVASETPELVKNFQSIGQKGLTIVNTERGIFRHGMKQEAQVKALSACSDFSAKKQHERAFIYELYGKLGYFALFGVKYHAELAHIERKWMYLKRFIRPYLDGKLTTLDKLLRKHWPQYTVHDTRKSGRHCRTTMQAYRALGDSASLDTLREEEQKQKSHRCEVNSETGKLMERANMAMTDAMRKQAANLTARREWAVTRTARVELSEVEVEGELRRRQKYKRKKLEVASTAPGE